MLPPSGGWNLHWVRALRSLNYRRAVFHHRTARTVSTTDPKKYLTQIRTFGFKPVFKMNEAFLRYEKGAETFDFTFRYVEPDLKVDRQFNFSRRVTENVEDFLKRLDINMDKVFYKKKKRKAKKDPTIISEKTDNVQNGKILLLKGDNEVELDQPCKIMIDDPREWFLMVFDKKYVIKYNAPWVNEMELPNCILEGFPVYPVTFDAFYTEKSRSRFTWFRSLAGAARGNEKWEKISEGFLYLPTKEDIGRRLKLSCVPCNETQEGLEVVVEGKTLVEAGPGHCPFETRHQFTKNKLNGNQFRITSYNILADTYADSDYSREVLFPYCPAYALAMDYRKLLTVKELLGYNSDLICLQEVDRKVYEIDLLPALSSRNYSGIFHTKGDTAEGLAVFYDKERFEVIDSNCMVMGKQVAYNEAFQEVWKNITNENARRRFLDRKTSLLVVTLNSLDNPGEILVLGNTHLYFHPEADHIRLLQGYFALTECQSTAEYVGKMYPDKNVTLVLSGDFNSSPHDGIYELMTKKYIPETHKDWKGLAEEAIENVSLAHDMSLASACGTPEYTNFTVEFADCLDYIFYQNDKLEVTKIIPMPTKEELSLHGAIPSVVFPSDHIAICADMKWKSQSNIVH